MQIHTSALGSSALTWKILPKYPPFHHRCLQNVASMPLYRPRGPSFLMICFTTSMGPAYVDALSCSLYQGVSMSNLRSGKRQFLPDFDELERNDDEAFCCSSTASSENTKCLVHLFLSCQCHEGLSPEIISSAMMSGSDEYQNKSRQWKTYNLTARLGASSMRGAARPVLKSMRNGCVVHHGSYLCKGGQHYAIDVNLLKWICGTMLTYPSSLMMVLKLPSKPSDFPVDSCIRVLT